MRTPLASRRLLAGALAAAPLEAQSGARPPARRSGVPAAYAAIREADLRRDVGEMASPGMRGREDGARPSWADVRPGDQLSGRGP